MSETRDISGALGDGGLSESGLETGRGPRADEHNLPAVDPGQSCAGGRDESAAATTTPRKRDSVLEVATIVLVALLLAVLLKVYVAEAYMIRGQSMQPTFVDGERVMLQKCLYDIQRGDVIIFSSSLDPGKDLIKRVVGLPGDTISVRSNGEVIVNGESFPEEYIQRSRLPRPEFPRVVVPPGSYFVLGDNRPQSQDSRFFDSIKYQAVKGKVVFRWWPLKDATSF